MRRIWSGESLAKIKRIFRENKPAPVREDLFAAIHIRRANLHDNRLRGSKVPDAVFLRIIHALRARVYPSRRVQVHIYSQGEAVDFEAFAGLQDVYFHLNEPVESTFTDMVLADTLVTSPSSMSYTAGVLCDGDVFYLPFWHPPLPHWKFVKVPEGM